MGRTGTATLPLHGGRVPEWLATRMASLGRVIVEAICLEYGRRELLRRLAHPFWFQSLGCVMGMDWHSSGITTSTLGALKRGLAPVEWELGIHVCGGRGRQSRRTPDELHAVADRVGLDGDALARTSRLTAKVDSAALQDGYQIYLHGFVVTDDGSWTVVQQGLDDQSGTARRYHWLSEDVKSFVDEPHSAITGQPGGEIVNLTDHRAAPSRDAQLALVESPDRVVDELRRLPSLHMPAHHDVTKNDVVLRRVAGALAAAAERAPKDFAELLLTPGVGARTVESLALVAEVVYGAPYRFSDPARFSLAHGGKDGHPFPVPLKVYDKTLTVMRAAVEQARLGNDEKLSALRRLDEQARRLERALSGEAFDAWLDGERAHSHHYGGRTVFGAARPEQSRKAKKKQLALF